MIATTISISIAGLSLLIAFFSLARLYKNDSKTETKDQTESRVRMETKIDNIGEQIKDVRDDVKAQGVRQTDMMERLTKVEESAKSAHHRIDGLEEKMNKEGE
jgi:peptidoglycan hydrolase CwlO-like protein